MLNPSQLHFALGQYLGKQLTPEAAAHIVAMATVVVDAAVPIERFDPVHSSGFVIQAERLRDILAELHPLHEQHWRETEKHRAGLPLDPDYAGMLQREREGRLLQVTLRKDGVLVGNLRMYLGTSIHSGTTFAEEDTLYIAPDYRGGYTAMRMMKFAECCLLALGVREIRADSKLVNNADKLMRAMRYKPVSIKFVKVFTDAAAAASDSQMDELLDREALEVITE